MICLFSILAIALWVAWKPKVKTIYMYCHIKQASVADPAWHDASQHSRKCRRMQHVFANLPLKDHLENTFLLRAIFWWRILLSSSLLEKDIPDLWWGKIIEWHGFVCQCYFFGTMKSKAVIWNDGRECFQKEFLFSVPVSWMGKITCSLTALLDLLSGIFGVLNQFLPNWVFWCVGQRPGKV